MLARLRTAIAHNLWIKLIALVLALLAYVRVYMGGEHVAEIAAPLRVTGLTESRVALDPYPTEVKIAVRAPGTKLIEWRLPGAARDDIYAEFRVDPDSSAVDAAITVGWFYYPPGVQILEILEPRRLAFRLDDSVARRVEVRPDEDGELPRGYSLSGELMAHPDSVTVTGPRTLLDSLDRVMTEPVRLRGRTGRFTQEVAVELGDARLSAEPPTVEVRADVERTDRLVVSSVPVVVRNLRRYGYTIDPGLGTVTLLGPRSRLEKIDELQKAGEPTGIIIAVDAKGLEPGRTTVRPTVELTGQLRLLEVQPESFTLTIIAPE